MTGVHRNTILKLVERVGKTCEVVVDETMRSLACERIQLDEIWCYVGKKERHVRPEDDAFDLAGHPKAMRAYAWSHYVGPTERRRFVAVLHGGKVDSPVAAVRAAIVADRRED